MLRRLLILLIVVTAPHAAARTSSELKQAIDKLGIVGSALYIAAHPDDENTAMLAWLANERLLRTGYLSLTRGDGGQNLIGDEKGELLGVVRTQELLAARRIDGAEQFFTRALDFGYTKSAQETMRIWNREAVLADVVWVIRRFQPDVIITRFPSTGEGGHGQHTTSSILAEEAFRAAADPTRFPEQLQHVTTWQPKRIFWNRFGWQRLDPSSPELANDLRIDLGEYNPLIGRSYTEMAGESRSQHKSQGFGSPERRGSVINYYKQTQGDAARGDILEGVETGWSRYPGGETMGALFKRISSEFDPIDPQKSLPLLLQALDELDKLGAGEAWAPRMNPWIEVKRGELLEVIRACAGLSIDISAADSIVNPGAELPVAVSVVNRSDHPLFLAAVASPYANPGKAPGTALENNKPVRVEVSIKLPEDYPYSQPYWLRKPRTLGMFDVEDQKLIGRPENPPAVPITVSLQDRQNRVLVYTVPVVFRRTDPVRGEEVRAVDVVPEVVVNIEEPVIVFPDTKSKSIDVHLQSLGGTGEMKVRLSAPEGWRVSPETAAVTLKQKRDETDVVFALAPVNGARSGTVRAEVELPNGKKLGLAMASIDYPHIAAQRILWPSEAKLVRADIKRRGTRIGYIMGSGDDIPAALRQIGYEVAELDDEDLDRGDFARFDAVVAGVRAYNTRQRLRVAHEKLLEYVRNGGTYVIQYNTSDDLVTSSLGPHPFKITRDRVTVEEAPVTMSAHPLLNTPNKITPADFEGWVQERGLYFTGEWDPKYETMLATHDPGESEKRGGQLFARHGKGVFLYTSYSWFRQLPAGVPGAYRLFANLVSAR
jgi:LmbE family N-acetylglucosaminyl deacetylase